MHGEGGTDSKLFVYDLFYAYEKYAANHHLNCELLDDENGHIVAKIKGNKAGELFSMESGKHIIQRIPPTENRGRKQTSVVSVAVLPLPPENTIKPLPENELEIKFQTGKQKAGGQNVNRVASACRMKHIPTGISVFINGRDQGANKKQALRVLTARVNEIKTNKEYADYADLRKKQRDGGGRGNKIRTYNYLENRAVDHRTGVKIENVDAIIRKGQFELLRKD